MGRRMPEQSVQAELLSSVQPPFEFVYGKIWSMFHFFKFLMSPMAWSPYIDILGAPQLN